MKAENQKSSHFAGLTESEVAKLIQQYGCGPVRFSGSDEALYERHLIFDSVMEMSAISARALRAYRSVGARYLSQRWIRASKYQAFLLSWMEFLIGCSLANNVTKLLLDPVVKHVSSIRHVSILVSTLRLSESPVPYRLLNVCPKGDRGCNRRSLYNFRIFGIPTEQDSHHAHEAQMNQRCFMMTGAIFAYTNPKMFEGVDRKNSMVQRG